jgi:hypothetical protein
VRGGSIECLWADRSVTRGAVLAPVAALIPRRIASFEVRFHASLIAAWTSMLFPLLAAFSMTVVTVLWWMR